MIESLEDLSLVQLDTGADADSAPRVESSDSAGEMLVWMTYYAQQLACMGWSFDEKAAFLSEEDNRHFLDHWSDRRLEQTHRELGRLSFD